PLRLAFANPLPVHRFFGRPASRSVDWPVRAAQQFESSQRRQIESASDWYPDACLIGAEREFKIGSGLAIHRSMIKSALSQNVLRRKDDFTLNLWRGRFVRRAGKIFGRRRWN